MIFNAGVRKLSQILEGFRRQPFRDEIRNFIWARCSVAFNSMGKFLEFSRGNFFKVFCVRFVWIVVNEFIGLLDELFVRWIFVRLKKFSKVFREPFCFIRRCKNFRPLVSSLSKGICVHAFVKA